MISGQITLSGVKDEAMLLIVEAMKQQPRLSMQQVQPTSQVVNNQPVQLFNNLVLAWNTHEGLQALATLLPKLAALTP
jgi:hypothetical protein